MVAGTVESFGRGREILLTGRSKKEPRCLVHPGLGEAARLKVTVPLICAHRYVLKPIRSWSRGFGLCPSKNSVTMAIGADEPRGHEGVPSARATDVAALTRKERSFRFRTAAPGVLQDRLTGRRVIEYSIWSRSVSVVSRAIWSGRA